SFFMSAMFATVSRKFSQMDTVQLAALSPPFLMSSKMDRSHLAMIRPSMTMLSSCMDPMSCSPLDITQRWQAPGPRRRYARTTARPAPEAEPVDHQSPALGAAQSEPSPTLSGPDNRSPGPDRS